MFDYQEFTEKPRDKLMKELSEAAIAQMEAEAEVEKAKENLLIKEQELRYISQTLLPKLMDEAGLAKTQTIEGLEISVKEEIRANIPEEKRAEAFAWLEEHQHGDLIKREFKVLFGRDQEEWAAKFEEDLKSSEQPLDYQLKRGVHASTLTAFVKAQTAEGNDVPIDLFGVFRQRVSKIKVK
jgi:hypothetical protein